MRSTRRLSYIRTLAHTHTHPFLVTLPWSMVCFSYEAEHCSQGSLCSLAKRHPMLFKRTKGRRVPTCILPAISMGLTSGSISGEQKLWKSHWFQKTQKREKWASLLTQCRVQRHPHLNSKDCRGAAGTFTPLHIQLRAPMHCHVTQRGVPCIRSCFLLPSYKRVKEWYLLLVLRVGSPHPLVFIRLVRNPPYTYTPRSLGVGRGWGGHTLPQYTWVRERRKPKDTPDCPLFP